jgi:DNA invertase Pin-like site-specific DNA recombinase
MQADEGQSLLAQERQVRAYADLHGLTLNHVFIERGVSGSTPLGERPEGAKLLAIAKAGDSIVTPKLDRMFRSALDALGTMGALRDHSVSLHMIDLGGDVTGNGIAKLVFTILAAVSEAERDRIRERISDVKRDQKARGRYLGGTAPFGFTIGAEGELIPDPHQQDAIRFAISRKAEGASLRSIAAELQAAGHKLSHVVVGRLLRERK